MQDKDTTSALEGVYFSMSRFINGSLTVVNNKLSDITGSVRASYIPETFYRMTATKNGYTTKVFDLEPIASSTYIVKMEASSSEIFINDGVSVYYSPKHFVSGNNSIEAVIISPVGLLSSYWFNVSYPGGSQVFSGTESTGETFNIDFDIVNPGMYDVVRVEYNFSTTVGDGDSAIFFHPINFANASEGSWDKKRTGYDDMGIFDKIMIVVMIIILLAGFGYLVGGLTGSLVFGLLGYVFFVATGFIPFWTIAITLFVGVILILRGGVFG